MIERDPDPYVLYLVVRTDLKMGGGKIAAQVGHAVHYLLRDAIPETWPTREEMRLLSKSRLHPETMMTEDTARLCAIQATNDARYERTERFRAWASTAEHAKIVLGASDEEYAAVKSENPEHFNVVDFGFTQVMPNTETVLALWPMRKSARSPTLQKLKLLP